VSHDRQSNRKSQLVCQPLNKQRVQNRKMNRPSKTFFNQTSKDVHHATSCIKQYELLLFLLFYLSSRKFNTPHESRFSQQVHVWARLTYDKSVGTCICVCVTRGHMGNLCHFVYRFKFWSQRKFSPLLPRPSYLYHFPEGKRR